MVVVYTFFCLDQQSAPILPAASENHYPIFKTYNHVRNCWRGHSRSCDNGHCRVHAYIRSSFKTLSSSSLRSTILGIIVIIVPVTVTIIKFEMTVYSAGVRITKVNSHHFGRTVTTTSAIRIIWRDRQRHRTLSVAVCQRIAPRPNIVQSSIFHVLPTPSHQTVQSQKRRKTDDDHPFPRGPSTKWIAGKQCEGVGAGFRFFVFVTRKVVLSFW